MRMFRRVTALVAFLLYWAAIAVSTTVGAAFALWLIYIYIMIALGIKV